jgi:Zn-dependent peptidase ImmA (M78 family)
MNVERLMQSADLPDATVPQHDPDEFDGDMSELARAVRAAWRLPDGPIPDVIGAMEEAGVVVIRLPFTSRHVDAISRWVPPTPPLIFVNRNLPADRERWSCCHELAHLVMHRTVNTEMEAQADRFTEAFLMPASDIGAELATATAGSDAMLRVGALKLHWKVSMQALLMRAKHLGSIPENRYRYLQVSMSRMGYRTREPREYDFPKDEATSLQDMLDLHLKDLGYTVDQLATHLRVSTDDVRDWYERADRLRVVAGHGS